MPALPTLIDFRSEWDHAAGLAYLNHGSFGLAPRIVCEARQRWTDQLNRNPMEFFVRKQETLLDEAAKALAKFLGGRAENLAFVPNATVAMNIIAENLPLEAGDEVLLNDHEYGAVIRIWGRKCQATGARTVMARLPDPLTTTEALVDALFERVTPRTRIIVVSHVTSATAIIMPVEAICTRAKALGIRVCIDGPHAIAMRPLALDALGCDYYCASLHKWLAAPLGSGFLYVAPRHKAGLKPTITSWGRSLNGQAPRWQDEFHWSGTMDLAAYLAVPDAIRFLAEIGWDQFRNQTHALARYAGERLCQEFDATPLAPQDSWYGCMQTLALPRIPRENNLQPGTPHSLQHCLAKDFGIEIPIIEWRDRMHIRVSCHLYNTVDEIERLVEALQTLLR